MGEHMEEQIRLLDEKSFDFWHQEMVRSIDSGNSNDAMFAQLQMIRFFRGDKSDIFSSIKIPAFYRSVIDFISANSKKYDFYSISSIKENSSFDIIDLLNISFCHLSIGDYIRAFYYLGKIQSMNQHDNLPPEYFFAIGICHVYFQRYKESIDFLTISHENSFSDIIKYNSIFFKAFSLMKINRIDESIFEFSKLLDLNHPQISVDDVSLQIASLLYKKGEKTKAFSIYSSLENKNLAIVSIERAYNKITDGLFISAFDDLKNVLNDEHSKFDRSILMGFCFYCQNDYINAYRCFRPLSNYDEIDWKLWFMLGLIFIKSDRQLDAINAFGNSFSINPASEKVGLNLAAAYELSWKFQDAATFYDRVSIASPYKEYAKTRYIYLKNKIVHEFEANLKPEIFELDIDELFIPPTERLSRAYLEGPLFLPEELKFVSEKPKMNETHQRISNFKENCPKTE
ncbi:hypothetical protein TRFO_12110 [Tritrichomonas foetus]|uniref:Uncharacterized protein n=1 Tax=Tritrichomonas foetus TaxID=1144522 RepID=A0A1J4J7B6_9EUKA|nr:hypothetical protein TRFO_12110 [Tritrichomonas foetus]|eukprot:OHS93084.1 hypothetical protein TRFO_12110 [Tritrichomonas foetus]